MRFCFCLLAFNGACRRSIVLCDPPLDAGYLAVVVWVVCLLLLPLSLHLYIFCLYAYNLVIAYVYR